MTNNNDAYQNYLRQLNEAVYAGDSFTSSYLPEKIEALQAEMKACQLWVQLYLETSPKTHIQVAGHPKQKVADVLNSPLVKNPITRPNPLATKKLLSHQYEMQQAVANQITNNFLHQKVNEPQPSDQGHIVNHGYPTSSVGQTSQGCSSGGFIDQLRRPNPPSGMFNKKQEAAISQANYDRDCRTPKKVSLYFNGNRYDISCAGNTDLATQLPGLTELLMCDPLIYGFHPLKESHSKFFGVAECDYPGMRTNITTWNSPDETNYNCAYLSKRVSRNMSQSFPHSKQKNTDHSLLMAAHLAQENPILWQRKMERFNRYCVANSKLKRKEKNSCRALGQRITEIKQTIETQTGTLFRDIGTETIPTSN